MEEMVHTGTMRKAVLLAAMGGTVWGQFARQPAQKPSAGVPLNAPPSALTATETAATGSATAAAQKPTRRAEVSYVQGRLTVKADNSSLNQILREIGRLTGIKITGGVAEERVFGTYGPGSTAEVLNRLLDGTSSNVMLIASEAGTPGELILTPRMGGPTPPNPNAKGFDDDSDTDEDAPRSPAPRGVTLFGGAQPAEPAAAPATPPAGPPVNPTGNGDVGGANGAAANPQSPNGVKTPQEIYQQLQQLRQQQQQQAQPPQ